MGLPKTLKRYGTCAEVAGPRQLAEDFQAPSACLKQQLHQAQPWADALHKQGTVV
jgi:hypothetical protein